jgi:mxaA protein
MTKLLLSLIFTFALLLGSFYVHAADAPKLPDAKEGVVSIQTQEPVRDVGLTVGDVLTRNITLKIKKPHYLVEESLPIVGNEKTYRGKPIGIELVAAQYSKKDEGDAVTHKIMLTYQVFTNATVVKPGSLPAEYVRLIDADSKEKDRGLVRYRIPSFEFRISPLAVFGQVKIEGDMSKYRGPLLLDSTALSQRLKILLTIFALSLLGLLYMLGKHAWLPRMGGPFAKSYRQIRKLKNTPQGIQNAVSSLHGAFNTSAGNSLFSDNLDGFLAKKPAFNTIKTEIQQFFKLSNQVFFEPSAKHGVDSDPIAWLAQFCRRCRDCERGLIPDSLNPANKA